MTSLRTATIHRKTTETDINIEVCLDGEGLFAGSTGVGFFDHMLAHIARHSLVDIKVAAQGDLHIDDHHTVEDTGIALGQALSQALGDRKGITRMGHMVVPMDEALVLCAVDISGRGFLGWEMQLTTPKLGDFTTELAPEFFRAVAMNAGWTLHIRQLAGSNTHHLVEAAFKAFGRAIAQAIALDPRVKGVPSTKGVL